MISEHEAINMIVKIHVLMKHSRNEHKMLSEPKCSLLMAIREKNQMNSALKIGLYDAEALNNKYDR